MATPTTHPACAAFDHDDDGAARRGPVRAERFDHAERDDLPRQDVALCASYTEAAQVVDRLAQHGFPTGQVTIVADRDPGAWEPAPHHPGRGGLVVGAVVGGVAGLLFGLLHRVDPLGTAVVAGLHASGLGAVLGAVVSVLVGSVRRRPAGRGRPTGPLGGGPSDVDRHAVVADDATTWVRAVTALYGSATGPAAAAARR